MKYENCWEIWGSINEDWFKERDFEIIGNEFDNPELILTEKIR